MVRNIIDQYGIMRDKNRLALELSVADMAYTQFPKKAYRDSWPLIHRAPSLFLQVVYDHSYGGPWYDLAPKSPPNTRFPAMARISTEKLILARKLGEAILLSDYEHFAKLLVVSRKWRKPDNA